MIGQFIQLLDKDKEVKGIVLAINSPGGTADSTQELADIVANTIKPVLAYVKSMAASAAYYVASQADYIVLSSESTASVGSIGVLMQYTNVAKALEKQGVEAEIIRATKSTDKAKLNSLEPLTDELRQEIVMDLDIAMETFEKYVKRGRASRLTSSEVFSGKMYRAKEALKLGLIDEIGNMKTAYTRIKQL
jgi:protease-4